MGHFVRWRHQAHHTHPCRLVGGAPRWNGVLWWVGAWWRGYGQSNWCPGVIGGDGVRIWGVRGPSMVRGVSDWGVRVPGMGGPVPHIGAGCPSYRCRVSLSRTDGGGLVEASTPPPPLASYASTYWSPSRIIECSSVYLEIPVPLANMSNTKLFTNI